MKVYGWGIDGAGRQHICKKDGVIVLFCVLPGWSVWDCIEILSCDKT